MRSKVLASLLVVVCAIVFAAARPAFAQGVTTSSVTGVVRDTSGLAVPGATITAVHEPSGTRYTAISQGDGSFSIQGMRVGGPYTVTASLPGFEPSGRRDLQLSLGVATDVSLTLGLAAVTEEVTVVGQSDPVFSSARTGAATTIDRTAIATLPTNDGGFGSYTRLAPQSTGRLSFGGVDNRLNNITVDGSYFNNSFGLAGAPGDRTGVAPISSQAIEQLQVSVAPYDVRQGNFVGAGVNAVTRSGTNQLTGSAYMQLRSDSLVGKDAGDNAFDPGTFDYKNFGMWAGGPVRRNRAFFFVNLEDEALTQPGTTFRANGGGEPTGGGVTRVLASDLDQLSAYLAQNFDYDTGGYQGYDHETPATRFLVKSDFNLSGNNRLTLRYNHLNSNTDVLLSNSSSLGFGTRRTNTTGLTFQNSNYIILENIRSFIGEWNTVLGGNTSNTLIAGFTYQDESRDSRGTFFPMVDVLEGGSVYTTFGFEPFTPNNELRYKTFQVQDNFTVFRERNTWTFGASLERYESENVFFPGSQSAYVYNSLADFYTDANDYLANPNRTVSPVNLRRFQVRWSNIPGQDKPLQPLEVWYAGVYAQNEWRPKANLTVTYGLRFDVPMFGDTGFTNSAADALTFRDENGAAVSYETGELPDANILWSPRVGFNWAVDRERRTQLRGGSGIFTGRPAYVWISNQIGNTGVLTGFAQFDNTTARPFHPDPDHYKPTDVTGEPASSYELALTNQDFKFPQVWRSNIAVDRRIGDWTATVDLIYSRDVNGIYYINANLPESGARLNGADNRIYWAGSNRIHSNVSNAIVLKNQDVGTAWNLAGSMERNFSNGFWVKGAFNRSVLKNTVDPSSIASGNFFNNPIAGDPNLAPNSVSYAGHRIYVAASYRNDWFKFGGTTVSMFFEGNTQGNQSYRYSGDLNRDGGTNNDLLYIPRDQSEMNFQTFTSGGVTYTAEQQAAAWDAYISQDEYLSGRRGEYAERGGVTLPMVFRTDLSIVQEIFADVGRRRNSLSFRFDILNVGNLLNSNWGVGDRLVNAQPLTNAGVDSQGRGIYRLRVVSGQLISNSLEKTADISDVWRMQFSLRYTFN